MTSSLALTILRYLLVFIGCFHLVSGFGLMFFEDFQRLAVDLYGAKLDWTSSTIYFIRILGSFVFVLGNLAFFAAKDPMKNKIIIIAFIEFFILRNINRHLFSEELYQGFGLSPLVNGLTSAFFGIQALVLLILLLYLGKSPAVKPQK